MLHQGQEIWSSDAALQGGSRNNHFCVFTVCIFKTQGTINHKGLLKVIDFYLIL